MFQTANQITIVFGLGCSNSSQPELKRLNAQTVYGHKAYVAAYYLVCLYSAIHVSSISGLVLFGKILYTLQQWVFLPPRLIGGLAFNFTIIQFSKSIFLLSYTNLQYLFVSVPLSITNLSVSTSPLNEHWHGF